MFLRRRHVVETVETQPLTRDDILGRIEPDESMHLSPEPPPHEESFAPLFVKVEKYNELLTSLGEIKSFINGIKQVFSTLQQVEEAREDAIKILRASVQRLERAITEVDAELMRPIVSEAFPHGEAEIKGIESSLQRLSQQLSGLRKELETFRGEGG